MKDISGLIGQYAHGNEPSHHVAYLFSYAGQPWKTQEKVRQIMDDFYTNAPDGLIGNEDCGQMSAWLILSAMGFYPVTPGSDIYVLGTPWFKEMEVQFENGKTFTITTDHPSPKSFYVQKVLLNGQSYDKSFIRHQDIKSGSHLHFKMGKHPNETWGNPPESRPKSIIQDHLLLPMPYINSPDKRIRRSIQISMGAPIAGSEIYYTLDGTMPDKTSLVYSQPIQLTESAQVIAIALHPEMGFSYPAMAEFVKIDTNLKIRLLSNYHPNYSAGGPDALIDGLRGPDNWRLGGWQGYQGTDFEAIVDMGSKKTMRQVADEIHDEVMLHGWNESLHTFTQTYDNTHVDASLLLMAEYGFISYEDVRYRSSFRKIKEDLFHNGLMYRYVNEDDFGRPTSSFTICTFWLIQALFRIGCKEEAREIFDQLLACGNHLGLFSEDIDFSTKRLLGNFPQAYSHLALINTAILFSEEQYASRFIKP